MRISTASCLMLAFVASPVASQITLSNADKTAAFRAAGFKRLGSQWRSCDAPPGSVYEPGKMEQVRDLNGDGRPEAIITEGSIF